MPAPCRRRSRCALAALLVTVLGVTLLAASGSPASAQANGTQIAGTVQVGAAKAGAPTSTAAAGLELSVTRQMLRVEPDGIGQILPAHVGCGVGAGDFRRIQNDRLDDHQGDQGAFDSGSNAQPWTAKQSRAPTGGYDAAAVTA